MLPSSVRRVVASAPQKGLVAPCLAASTPKAAIASLPALARGHQRRCSSSKPSSSDNGSSDIAAGQSVPAATSTRADGKAAGEKRKRRNKDVSEASAAMKKLPSVPSTHHMSHEALGLSNFFSLHRPISITQTMPRTVTDEAFATIFASRSKSAKLADTMSTLDTTIGQLEKPMAQMTISVQQDSQGADGLDHGHNGKGFDGESNIYFKVDAMSGEFVPFRPPPSPQVQTQEGIEATAEAPEDPAQHRTYRAMFTIEESTDSTGQTQIMVHSPSIVPRRVQRQARVNGSRHMEAISVKRQRKLKMKKQKYKKLMRKTRNERRKLDRI